MNNKKLKRRLQKKERAKHRKQQKKNKQGGIYNESLAQNMVDQKLVEEMRQALRYAASFDDG